MGRPHIIVIGTSLAGTVAALEARRLHPEASIVQLKISTAHALSFCGHLGVFGPAGPSLSERAPNVGPSVRPSPSPARTSPAERLDALLRQRLFHPYTRIAPLGVERLKEEVAHALDLLGAKAERHLTFSAQPRFTLNDAGHAIPFDIGADTLFDGSDGPLVWIGLETASDYMAEMSAEAAAERLPGREVSAHLLEWPQLEGPPLSETAAMALLDQGYDATHGRAFLDAVATVAARTPSDAILLLPPILGRTFERAAGWKRRLEAVCGRRVFERATVHQPYFALRLLRYLDKARQNAGIEVPRGALSGLGHEVDDDGAITSIETPHRRYERVDQVVLAAGRFLEGGFTTRPPLRSAFLDLPLYRGGYPFIDVEATPGELMADQPWSDHPLSTLGLGVDHGLRPLRVDTRPAYKNLFAAGRAIGGSAPAHDGTAGGVDLVTGLRAARAVASLSS